MALERTIEDLWTLRFTPRPPTPRECRARVAALAQDGGFLNALSLVAEYLVGAEPCTNFSTVDEEAREKSQNRQHIADSVHITQHVRAFERRLAADRRDRHRAARTLRLVGKAWSQALAVPANELLLGIDSLSSASSLVVPFSFRCLRSLTLDCLTYTFENFEGQRLLPDWFENLKIESIEFEDHTFRLPALPALPNLKRVSSLCAYCASFEDCADAMRDRPLEAVRSYVERFHEGWEDPELLAGLDRLFTTTVLAETIREFRLQGYGKALTVLPECLRGLRLEVLDISWLAVTELPAWLGEMPLVELILSSTPIETLPRSLRFCRMQCRNQAGIGCPTVVFGTGRTLRSLDLDYTPLGGVHMHAYPTSRDDRVRCLHVPPHLVAPPFVYNGMRLQDVPPDELTRRTDELMGISLALPALRIRLGSETELWHAQCGKHWTDEAFIDEW